MTTQKKNSRLSARAILCLMFCLLMAFTVALSATSGDHSANSDNTKTIFAWENIVTWVFSLASLVVAICAICASRKSRRAAVRSADAAERSAKTAEDTLLHEKQLTSLKLVVDAINRVLADKEVLKLVNNIDGSKIEVMAGEKETIMILERLLSQLTIVAYARERKLVNDDDLCMLLYDFLRVIDKEAVRCHMGLKDLEDSQRRSHKMLLELADYCLNRPK